MSRYRMRVCVCVPRVCVSVYLLCVCVRVISIKIEVEKWSTIEVDTTLLTLQHRQGEDSYSLDDNRIYGRVNITRKNPKSLIVFLFCYLRCVLSYGILTGVCDGGESFSKRPVSGPLFDPRLLHYSKLPELAKFALPRRVCNDLISAVQHQIKRRR